MNVAFYAPMKSPNHPTPSGDRQMARLIMEALRQAEHRPWLVALLRSWEGRGDVARQERLRKLATKLAVRCIHQTRSAPTAQRPDIWLTYHAYHKAPDWIGPRVSQALNIPYVIAEASWAPKQCNGPWHTGHMQTQTAIQHADAIIMLNPDDIECVSALVNASTPMLRVKPFLDVAEVDRRLSQSMPRQALATRYDLDHSAPWLITVAMMRHGDKLESYRRLVDALRISRDLSWQILVVGDGEAREDVEAAFAPFRNRTHFLGRLPRRDTFALLPSCDLFVWPAVNEAYGMALLEAHACGVPIVSTDTGGVSTIVTPEETGILVSKNDNRAFGQALRCLLNDAPLRDRMAHNARAKVLQYHDIPRAAAHIDRALRAAVRAHSASRLSAQTAP